MNKQKLIAGHLSSISQKRSPQRTAEGFSCYVMTSWSCRALMSLERALVRWGGVSDFVIARATLIADRDIEGFEELSAVRRDPLVRSAPRRHQAILAFFLALQASKRCG